MAKFVGAFGPNMPPFEEAVKYFRAKTPMTRAAFDELEKEMQAKAFTAARVYAADQLQAVYDAVEKAISTGGTLEQFREAVQEILTGPGQLETVFRTNVSSAYGAGHWEQAQETKALRPYATFWNPMDGRETPECEAIFREMQGRALPLDDPYVQANWTPRHYN